MRWDIVEAFLALVSFVSLVAFGLFTLAMAVLVVMWPLGVSPSAHPVAWAVAGGGVLASLAGVTLPYFAARAVRAVEAGSR